jgi:hypothetical protein
VRHRSGVRPLVRWGLVPRRDIVLDARTASESQTRGINSSHHLYTFPIWLLQALYRLLSRRTRRGHCWMERSVLVCARRTVNPVIRCCGVPVCTKCCRESGRKAAILTWTIIIPRLDLSPEWLELCYCRRSPRPPVRGPECRVASDSAPDILLRHTDRF